MLANMHTYDSKYVLYSKKKKKKKFFCLFKMLISFIYFSKGHFSA